YWVRPADGNSEGTPSSPDGDVVELATDAFALGPDSGIEFVGKVDDDTYQFLDPPGGAHDIVVGDVLFGVYQDVNTGDFHSVLVRVTKIVSRAGDLVTVDVFRASITDIIKNGAINGSTGMGNNTTTTDTSIRKPCSIGPDGPTLHSRTVRKTSAVPEADPTVLSPEEYRRRYRPVTPEYVKQQS